MKPKIKKSAIAVIAVSLVIVIGAGVYFSYILPLLNLLSNQAPPTQGDHTGIIVNGDNVIDLSGWNNDKPNIPSDGDENNEVISGNTNTPGQALTSVTQVTGDQVKFAPDSKTILLLGLNVEEYLYDSIFLLNIDQNKKTIKLVSIPRDAYVPYSQEIVEAMKAHKYYYSVGSFKLNAAGYMGQYIVNYKNGKFGNSQIDFMCVVLNSILPHGVSIDDYVLVDFDGFMTLIDAIGGVDIDVPENMYKNTGELILPKGVQHLNAQQALFFVRYRYRLNANGQNTGTGGDTYRKTNQLSFIVQASSQVITPENMTPSRFAAMMDSMKNSVYHSVSDFQKITDYAALGMDFTKGQYSVEAFVVVGEEIDPFGDHASYVKIF